MKEEGLVAVPNPSASFLGDRTLSANASSAVTVMIEGTRPLLLEVQALCSPVHQVAALPRTFLRSDTAVAVEIERHPAGGVYTSQPGELDEVAASPQYNRA